MQSRGGGREVAGMEEGGERVVDRFVQIHVDTARDLREWSTEAPRSVCDCIIYPLSLLYAAINSVYTPGKVFPKHRRAWLPAYPLSILLCPDIVPTT